MENILSGRLKIGINGLGRIGRNIFRQLLDRSDVDLVFINDPQMTGENLAYLIQFDSVYGRLGNSVQVNGNNLTLSGKSINLFRLNDPLQLSGIAKNVDVIIEASGLRTLGASLRQLINLKFTKKVICTYSDESNSDISLVLGVNDLKYEKNKHHYISGTICDVVSLAPILAAVNKQTKIVSGNLLTLHPWLSYQNLVDGPVESVSSPGHVWPDFALGRSSPDNLIPKNTTALKVLKEVMPELPYKSFQSMSFRIPTATVTSSIVNLKVNPPFDIEKLHNEFRKNKNLEVVTENLVSCDFKGTEFGASIDTRWTELSDNSLRIVSWYDNEYGYSAQIIRLLDYVLA